MKIAISIAGEALDSPFDARFGRAAAFCLIDPDTGDWQVLANPGISASGGAGIQAAQFIARQEARAVVSGAFGPNAFEALEAAGIQMLLPPGKEVYTAADILALYRAGRLVTAATPSHENRHGKQH